MRIASPQPALCSVCYGAWPDRRYVDFEVVHDGTPVIDPDTGAIAHLPTGQQTLDDLFICEVCMKQATELLGLKAELHARQLREIRRLEIANAHWRDTVKRLQAELERQVDTMLEEPIIGTRPPGRPPKVAA